MALLSEDQVQWPNSIQHIVCTLFLYFLTVFHCIRTYQDLYTTKRASVAHRRKAPTLTPLYKSVQYLTTLSIIFTALALTGLTINVSVPSSYGVCTIVETLATWSLHVGKLTTYSVCFGRLQMIYKDSHHGYKQCTLIAYVILTIIITIFLIVAEGIAWLQDGLGKANVYFIYDYNDTAFPAYCVAVGPEILFFVFILFDLGMNILYCFMFIIPLKKTIKLVTEENSTVSKKILFVGYKVTILTIVLCASSILLFVWYVITEVIILPLDSVINVICLMFMTAYYPDNTWYRRYCCLCILCCDKNKYSTKPITETKTSTLTSTNDDPSKPSVDTMSQLRTAQPKVPGSPSEDNMVDIVSVDSSSNAGEVSEPQNP